MSLSLFPEESRQRFTESREEPLTLIENLPWVLINSVIKLKYETQRCRSTSTPEHLQNNECKKTNGVHQSRNVVEWSSEWNTSSNAICSWNHIDLRPHYERLWTRHITSSTFVNAKGLPDPTRAHRRRSQTSRYPPSQRDTPGTRPGSDTGSQCTRRWSVPVKHTINTCQYQVSSLMFVDVYKWMMMMMH